jgi:hypothetical protein
MIWAFDTTRMFTFHWCCVQVFWQAIAQARGRVIGSTSKQWIIPEAYPIFAVIGAGKLHVFFTALAASSMQCLSFHRGQFSAQLLLSLSIHTDFFPAQISGGLLAGGFMAYSSSTNPFFMVNKHKRMFGDAGNGGYLACWHSCSIFLWFVHLFYQFTPSTTCPKRRPSPTALPTHIIRLEYISLGSWFLVSIALWRINATISRDVISPNYMISDQRVAIVCWANNCWL